MIDLTKISDDDLKAELRRRGFYVDNLWNLGDVAIQLDDLNEVEKTNIQLTSEEKMEILHEVVNSDYVKSHINGEIYDYIDNNYR